MRLRRKVFGFLAIGFGSSSIISLLMPFLYSVEANGQITNSKGHGLFDKYQGFERRFMALNDVFQPAFAQILSVCACILVVLYLFFILFFLIQLSKKSSLPCRAILKAISITIFLVSIFALASGLIFIFMNRVHFKGRILLSFKWAYGIYIMVIGGLITGACGFISELRYRTRVNMY